MNISTIREQLLAQRAEIERSLHEAERDQEVEVVGRLSRASALQARELAFQNERRRSRELMRIDSALARIERGTYGYCALCDEEIAPGRLEANPAIPLCIKCAQTRSTPM
ncbi:MAG: TraR/DksA family transcriptional regulator [Rhodospirillaceae bacterium]